MTDDERQLHELEREMWFRKCRQEFLPFCIEALPLGQSPALHHRLLIAELQALLQGKFDRLLVLLPYGSAKTTYTTRLLPAFAMAHKPGIQIISVSNTEMITIENATEVQRIIRDNAEMLGYSLDNDRKDRFYTSNRSSALHTSVGGTVLGFRANLIIADDLIRSREEAFSEGQRDKQYAWFTNDLLSRRLPDLKVVVVGTPQHEDDILARLQNEGTWRVLRLPALAEANDPLGRKLDEPLWLDDPRTPSYGQDLIRRRDELMATLPHLWHGPYQLAPYPPEGDIFHPDKMPILDEAPHCIEKVRAWDLAASQDRGDATCGLLIGRKMDADHKFSYVILDLQHERLGPHEVRQLILRTAQMDGYATRIWLPRDPGSAGVDLVDSLTRELAGYPVKDERMSGSKQTRALIPAAQLNLGRIAMVRANWNNQLKAELAAFPGGRHDDIVDALSLAYSKIECDSRLAVWMRL
jgi:predicted phage terminase large subunit-like protein